MTIQFFNRHLGEAEHDPLLASLEHLRQMEPKRALSILTEDLVDEWWPWKPEAT